MKWFKEEYYRNVLQNYVFRLISMALGLFTVRINLNYLGATLYGLWLTISAVISWMNSGNFGLSFGLRNELAIAYGQNDIAKQEKLITTAKNSIGKISLILFFVIILVSEGLFYFNIMETTLRIPMYITGVFFCINLRMGIVDSIAYSYQKSWLVSTKMCISGFCSILAPLLLMKFNFRASLSLFATLNGLSILVPNLFLAVILHRAGFPVFANHKYGESDNEIKRSIVNTGLGFFGLQLCGIILYNTDNVIINYCLSSEMVTKYAAITKIYDTGSSLFSILLIALWSAVTVHIAQNDYLWIKKKIRELLWIWCAFSVGVVGVSFLLNPIVRIWLGENAFYYEPPLVALFGLYCITTAFSAIFVNIMNGAGKVRLQLGLSIFGAVINIPLSVFLAKTLGWGIFGIKFATFVNAVITAVGMPIQALCYVQKGVKKDCL